MAEQEPAIAQGVDDEEEDTPGYKAPAKKSVDEIKNLDQDDESLVKYKQTLLGEMKIPFPDDPRNVIMNELEVIERDGEGKDKEAQKVNLKDQVLEEIAKTNIHLTEGCEYRVQIYFFVQREIVSGLKYTQTVYRKGIKVDKDSFMVGSYGPKSEAHMFTTPLEEAPKGMLARGEYMVKSKFIDDDKNSILEWKWKFTLDKKSKE